MSYPEFFQWTDTMKTSQTNNPGGLIHYKCVAFTLQSLISNGQAHVQFPHFIVNVSGEHSIYTTT